MHTLAYHGNNLETDMVFLSNRVNGLCLKFVLPCKNLRYLHNLHFLILKTDSRIPANCWLTLGIICYQSLNEVELPTLRS